MYFKFFLLLVFLVSPVSADELLYIASGNAIEVKKIDRLTGKLTDLQKVEHPGLSKFTFSPDKSFLYAQASMKNNRKQTAVITYKITDDGKLTYLDIAAIKGSTTELKTDHTGKFLTAADYGAGMVTVWKLENGVYKGSVASELKLEKKVHAVRFSKDNKVLCIPATGPNVVYELAFDEKTGKISEKTQAKGPASGASQPRHLIFHPEMDIAYTTLERVKPGVGTWKWDPDKGELQLLQNLANHDDETGAVTNADLHMSPDNKFLYVSCRDKNARVDHIALYKISPEDGQLTFVKKFPCENIPRSFGLNKSGDFMYVCGQRANKMGVYKIDKATGFLTKVTQYDTGAGPIWVETLIK